MEESNIVLLPPREAHLAPHRRGRRERAKSSCLNRVYNTRCIFFGGMISPTSQGDHLRSDYSKQCTRKIQQQIFLVIKASSSRAMQACKL
jgi:hypothetical protein